MRKSYVTLLVSFAIITVCCIILVVIYVSNFLREAGGYIEDMEHLRCNLIVELHSYYHEHKHYPEKIDLLPLHGYFREYGSYPQEFERSLLPFSIQGVYPKVLADVNYSSDGNSFEFIWKRPRRLAPKFDVILERGLAGQSTYSHEYVETSNNIK